MVKLSEQLRSTHNQDGAVVLDVAQGKMFGLNPVGSRILELLRAGLTEIQIKAEVSREFSADIEIVRKDVDEFLVQLAKHRLITMNGNALGEESRDRMNS
jgi:hypothetical protein